MSANDPADYVRPEIVWTENSMRLVFSWRHVVFRGEGGLQGVSETVIGCWKHRCPAVQSEASAMTDRRFLVIWPYDTAHWVSELNNDRK